MGISVIDRHLKIDLNNFYCQKTRFGKNNRGYFCQSVVSRILLGVMNIEEFPSLFWVTWRSNYVGMFINMIVYLYQTDDIWGQYFVSRLLLEVSDL